MRKQRITRRLRSGGSLDDLNGAVWALSFAGSADQALFNLYWHGLAVFDFVNAHGASVYAGLATSALVIINYYFYQCLYLF